MVVLRLGRSDSESGSGTVEVAGSEGVRPLPPLLPLLTHHRRGTVAYEPPSLGSP